MKKDRKNGLKPCAVQLNYGSTNTCGYDDLDSFRGFSEQEKVWLHVDAAYAGPALILPEYRERSLLMQEIATSFNFNGSKWFLCGVDSAFLFIKDRQLLKRVFAADGDYMARSDAEQIYNPEFKDWSRLLNHGVPDSDKIDHYLSSSIKSTFRSGVSHPS